MEPPMQRANLCITHVDREGPFLKVFGQNDRSNSLYVEQILLGCSAEFEEGVGKIPYDKLQVGTLVCAKYKDGRYYRARIVKVEYLNGFCEVTFVDYGNKDIVLLDNVRSLQILPASFISLPPLATGFILAEAHCPGGGEWQDQIFNIVAKELLFKDVQCNLLIQATQHYLINIFIHEIDVALSFIRRGLMQPIPLNAQQAVLLSMSIQAPTVVQPPQPNMEINTYKACTLEPNHQYAVYVSFINDGPTHFSVQLQQYEETLSKVMADINKLDLRSLEELPLPGTVCLAKCQEDGHLCRAVVTNEVDNNFKVFYVDFGNYETLPFEFLYQIPFKFVLPKVMAIRVALDGVEKSTVTMEMLLEFKKFVDNRLLYMKVLPSVKKAAIPKCILWDPKTKTNALDVINRAAKHTYPDPLVLHRGFTQPVKVSYVFGCNRFFVQLLSQEIELNSLMIDLQAVGSQSDQISEVKVGLPCCALFPSDQQWYRAEIVEIVDQTQVKVRYIDHGNEEIVPIECLRNIEGELLTVLRPQAIESCLNGYQNVEPDDARDSILDQLILEQTFTMKVVEMLGKKALVELSDSNNFNVASLLLDKIAAASRQNAPVLVQADNTLKHRKSNEFSDNFANQRKPAKDWSKGENQKSYERTNDRSWRNDTRTDSRQNDFNRNDSDSTRRPQNRNNYNKFERNDRPPKRDFQRDDRYNRQRSEEASGDNNWNPDNNKNNSWSNPAPRVEGWGDSEGDKPKKRFDDRRGGRPQQRRDDQQNGYKNSFKKDGSEFDSSSSEKSFRKGPRTSSRNDLSAKRFTDRSNSWNVSEVSAASSDPAPVDANYIDLDVTGAEAPVQITWFHNPQKFYCQLKTDQNKFQQLMEEIQSFYINRKPSMCAVGQPVVGRFPEDNVFYRAKVLEAEFGQFKVLYVDFGNEATIPKVWPLENKFMELPAQAICCSLEGIVPIEGEWPGPEAFADMFNKETFTAKFLHTDYYRNVNFIHLVDNNEDMNVKLISANFAKVENVASSQAPVDVVDIPQLLHQQFRITLKSVNNLNDIIVALECGLAINCKCLNMENESVLKERLEATLIVSVEAVEDNILTVKFFDNSGKSLSTPDETLSPICPLFVKKSTIFGYISHATENSVFIQPDFHAIDVTTLLDRLYDFYEDDGEANMVSSLETGMIYAVRSPDTNWYRGKLIDFDFTTAKVEYLDYGNGEEVVVAALRVLKEEFFTPNALCLQVKLVDITESALDLLEKEVLIKDLKLASGGWEGSIQNEEVNVLNEVVEASQPPKPTDLCSQVELVDITTESAVDLEKDVLVKNKSPEGQESNQNEDPQAIEIPSQQSIIEEPPQQQLQGTQVILSHIDSPTEFYLQLLDADGALKELQTKLQELAATMSNLEAISIGILCAAPYSADQQWYRAEVLDADEDITTVRFVDYGNTDVIDNKTTQIKTLPTEYLSLAVYASRCSLKLKAIDEEWSPAALEAFEGLCETDRLSAEFIMQDEKTNIVELYANGVNIRETLLSQNLAVPCEIVTESKSTCFVSHLNSPSEFWVQMSSCTGELEWIAEQLSGAESFPELEDLTPGTLCTALFPDDQMWYRARILSNTVAGIELLFIDYGNSCISSSIRQLPEDLVVTPPLAQKCCLQRPEGISYWTKEAQDQFSEISASGLTIFEIKKLTTGETATVELLVDGENVVPKIMPTLQNLPFAIFESLDKFQLETIEGEMSLEPMPGTKWDEEANKKFLELYKDTTFQVEILNDNRVRLYVNLVDIRSNLGGIGLDQSIDDLKTEEEEVVEGHSEEDNKVDSKEMVEEKEKTVEEEISSEMESLTIQSDPDPQEV